MLAGLNDGKFMLRLSVILVDAAYRREETVSRIKKLAALSQKGNSTAPEEERGSCAVARGFIYSLASSANNRQISASTTSTQKKPSRISAVIAIPSQLHHRKT